MLVLALAVVSFGRDVHPVEASKDDLAKTTWPLTLELGVDAAAKVVGNTLTVTGHLSNRAEKPVTVAYSRATPSLTRPMKWQNAA